VLFGHTELEYPSIYAIDCGKAGRLRKLRHPRWFALSTLAVAMALISAVPAGALAEGTEAAPPAEGSSPPAPAGWVPPSGAAEDTGDAEGAGDAAATTRRGSSLGSGGSLDQSRSPEEQPAPSEQPAPTPVSSGSYEPEAPSPSTSEEPASTLRAVPTVETEPQVEPVVVDASDSVARKASPQGSTRSASSLPATRAANTSEQAATDTRGLLWPVLIVCLLILLYAGARLLLGPVELDIFRSSPFRRVRRGYPRA
jgi:hypothetical protein